MQTVLLGALFVLGFASGWLAVYLLLRPGSIGRIVPFAPAAGIALFSPALVGFEPLPSLAGLIATVGGALVGWTAASYALFREPDRTPVRVAPLPADAPERTAVVYFTHGEPETYEPEPWVNMLFELDHTVPSFPPKPVWPFIMAGIRKSFDVVTESPHGRIHAKTMAAVRSRVGRSDVSWYLSFLDADPPLRDAVARACAEGATRIVFLTVFLTDSDHTAEADDMDEGMGLTEAGIEIRRTSVLWNDPRLARMIADKIVRAAESRDRSTVGVMLVGHGQPHEWDLVHPTETEQEQAFRVAIRDLLIADGFREDLVSDAWMSFREPRVPARVRELADRGATTVIGVPVTISADSLHSLYDTPELVRKGARGTSLEVIDIGGWNTEPLLVEILAERTIEAIASLDADRAPALQESVG